MKKVRIFRLSFALGLALAALSGCVENTGVKETAEPRITEAELTAYCPVVIFDESATFYNVYARGGEGKPEKVVYQAVLDDLTRVCRYREGRLDMQVSAAGRIVPGPEFRPATITLPVQVRVIQSGNVIYSKVYKYTASGGDGHAAAQFIFSDDKISIPEPAGRNMKVYIGFTVKDRKTARADNE